MLRIVSVVSGDTVRVRLGQQRPYAVHLVGTKIPKSSCEAKAARSNLRSYVKPGAVVRLTTDRKAPARTKRALNRYVELANGTTDLGATQVFNGYAGVNHKVNFTDKKRLIRFQNAAVAKAKGYYSSC